MGFRLPRIVNATQSLKRTLSFSETTVVPKGHFAVYVGQVEKKRFVVPISFLKHPSFQILYTRFLYKIGTCQCELERVHLYLVSHFHINSHELCKLQVRSRKASSLQGIFRAPIG